MLIKCLTCAGKKDSYQNEKFMRGCRFLEAELQDMDRILSGRYMSPYLSCFSCFGLFIIVVPLVIGAQK